jgi:hypothetical protein
MAHSKEFKKLEAKWYKKLKKEGFNDIEENESEYIIRPPYHYITDNRVFSSIEERRNHFNAKQYYYYMANQFLNTYKFKNNRERNIWEYHVNGISYRDITKLLKKARIKTNRTTVGQIIASLRVEMKKMYNE